MDLLSSKIILIASTRDPASINIRDQLIEFTEFSPTEEKFGRSIIYYSKELDTYLITIDQDLTFADILNNLPQKYGRLLFLSRHSSKSGLPALLVHFPGNWSNDTSMGGKAKSLSFADAILHRALVSKLVEYHSQEKIPKKYQIGIEVTHHGPTIDKACTFIEIGSTIEEWKDQKAAKILAEVIIDALKLIAKKKYSNAKIAIGFGGPHYAPKFFQKMTKDVNLLIGHIAPKYVIDTLDRSLVSLALGRTLPKPNLALLDWKGLRSQQRKYIIDILENINLTYERI